MTSFKEFAESDLDSVFFNEDEFADEHELDGEKLSLVIVENNFDSVSQGFSRNQLNATQEVFQQLKTIYVKSKDYYVPKVDSTITLDGFEYYVEEAREEQGIIRIVVSSNES